MLKDWTTVTIGAYPTIQAIRAALGVADIHLSTWPEKLIDQVPLATEQRIIRLAVVKPSVLFSGRRVRLGTIYQEIERQGGTLCPPEVGLILHLQLAIAYSTLYVIAMEPLVVEEVKKRFQVIFSVENGIGTSGLWLRGLEGNLSKVWNPYNDPHLDTFVVQIKDD